MTVYYQDELVTLYHGDCREFTEWLDADVLVTDPPYGIGWYGTTWKTAGAHPGIRNDEDTSVRDSALTIWGRKPALVFGDVLQPFPPKTASVLVYQKPPDSGFFGRKNGWRKDWEAVFVCGDWPNVELKRSSVLKTSAPSLVSITARRYPNDTGAGHPHAKPLDVMEQLVGAGPSGVIADPFAGAGATLRAAKNLGRKAIGVEVDEQYCEIIARRMDQYALDFGGVQ